MKESVAREFVEFLEETPHGTVRALGARVLLKCRQLTGAEAGTIFILRGHGARRRLEAVHTQNDRIKAGNALFVIPVDQSSIAGYVASTAETLFVDDVYNLPGNVPYHFNPRYDRMTGFKTRCMMCFPLTTPEDKVIGVVQLINRVADGAPGTFPPSLEEMVAPVSNLVGRIIERMIAHEQIALRNQQLVKRNTELKLERERTEHAFRMSVELLARAAERYDEDTGQHVKRVSEYCFALSNVAGLRKSLADEVRWSAVLHDIGKMSIDHTVLNKPGRLNEAEMLEMQSHTVHGHEILKGYPRLATAAEIAFAHHEQWLGGGYPRRLAGEEIPLPARIVAIADVYDALRSARSYKPAFPHEKVINIMLHGDDRLSPAAHFDPKLLAVFGQHHDAFARIWDELGEKGPTAEVA